MRKIITFVVIAFVGLISLNFVLDKNKVDVKGLTWYTDFNEANALAEASNKPIFAFFTGSDWCGWCKRLQANVFRKEAFVSWAKENVILLELDFPRRTKLADELAQQNRQLAGVFQVRGYPTVWLFNTTKNTETNQINIVPYGSLGYPQGAQKGKEEVKFISDANQIMAKKK